MTTSYKDVVIYSIAAIGGYFFGKKIFEVYTKKPLKKETVDTTANKPSEIIVKDFDNWKINLCKEKCVTEDEVMSAYASHKPHYVNVEIEGEYQVTENKKSSKGTYKGIVKTIAIDLPEKDGKKYLRSIVYQALPDGHGPKLGEELIFSINQVNSFIEINEEKEIKDVINFIRPFGWISG